MNTHQFGLDIPNDPLYQAIVRAVTRSRGEGAVSAKGGRYTLKRDCPVNMGDVVQAVYLDRLEQGFTTPETWYKGIGYAICKATRRETRHLSGGGFAHKTETPQEGDHPARRPYQRLTGKLVAFVPDYEGASPEADANPLEKVQKLAVHLDRVDRIILDNYLKGNPHKEVAKALGITQGRVSQIWHRIIARMKVEALKQVA